MKNGKLADKVAVVTGASKGIGAGIAKLFAAEGAAVVVNYAASKDAAERVVADITGSGGKAIAVKAEPSSSAATKYSPSNTPNANGSSVTATSRIV